MGSVPELVRTVWRLPRYRRASWTRQALHAPQVGLLDSFARLDVHIRGPADTPPLGVSLGRRLPTT
jgi:hypothetical protein